MKSLVVGIAGGTGSGKTTLCQRLCSELGSDQVAWLQHDNYYRDLSHLSPYARTEVNFDHPESLETDLLIIHLQSLVEGDSVVIPSYDFNRHLRIDVGLSMEPRPIVLVEGVLIFTSARLRSLMDLKVFLDADDDTRLIRRIRRDMAERNRTLTSVLEQYEATVKPMHDKYVYPSKRYADVVIPASTASVIGYNLIGSYAKMVLD